MAVLYRVEGRDRPVQATRDDNADFGREIDESLQHQRFRLKLFERRLKLVRAPQKRLTFAVVALGGSS